MSEIGPVLLISPPPSDPTQPYSSLPTLTGFLRNRGVKVIQRDLGIDLLDMLLTPSALMTAHDCAMNRAGTMEGESEDNYLERYCGIIGLSDYIIGHVDDAKRVMHDTTLFYDIQQYQWASNILGLACELLSLPYHPTRLFPYSYETEIELSYRGLAEGCSRKEDNLFLALFEQKILPQIKKISPLFVGISTTYDFQMVPAFSLSRLIKKSLPELHVNIGGAFIQGMETQLLNDPRWFEFADSFVVGEGETALFMLADSLSNGRELGQVPNLITMQEGRPYASNLRWYEDITKLPCPDYDGLPLDRYLSPEVVLLLASTRGCYYGRCAFCDVAKNTKAFHRQMGHDQFIAHVLELHEKYGCKRFFICDDAMPPAKMREMARLVTERLPEVTWQTEARFEKSLTPEFVSTLKKGGCRQLSFGFESASQRVLNLMNKNNVVEEDRKILISCAENGIAVNLQTFIGFPTESRDEAGETINFLIENERYIASIGFGIFASDMTASRISVRNLSSEYCSHSIFIHCCIRPAMNSALSDSNMIHQYTKFCYLICI